MIAQTIGGLLGSGGGGGADKSVVVAIRAQIGQYTASLAEAGRSTRDFGRQVHDETNKAEKSAKSNLDKVSKAALVGAAGMALAFGGMAKTTMDFDRQLSELAAVADATSGEMHTLRDAAIDAGAATAFSATEAAEAQTELAKAGVSTADILGGGLAGALDLAAAGGLELGEAATYAANAMTTFSLSGKDVGRIADTLAAGANKSAADVRDIGMALQQSGLVAAQFGLTVEDSVAVLSMFAQAGLRGSDAGTSFKTMLQSLTPNSKKAAETMEELGIEMFDASGNFIGIAGAAGQLQKALGRLTQEQQAAALKTIFGSDAVRAATVLFKGGEQGVRDWTAAVTDSGNAGEVAAKRMDNLAGDIEELSGAFETAMIQGGSMLTPMLRGVTQAATEVVRGFSEIPAPIQATVLGFGALATAGMGVVGVVGTIYPKWQQLKAALDAMGTAGQFASRNMGRVATVVGTLGAALTIGEIVGERAKKFFVGLPPDVNKMTSALVDFGRQSQVTGMLAETFGGNLDKLSSDLDKIKRNRDSIVTLDWSKGVDRAINRVDSLDKAMAKLVQSGHTEEAKAVFDQLVEGGVSAERLNRELNDYGAALAEVETQQKLAGDSASELTPELKALAAEFGSTAKDTEAASEAIDAYNKSLKALFDPVFGMIDAEANLAAAQKKLNELVASGTATTDEMEEAQREALEAAIGYDSALHTLAQGVINGTHSVEQYNAKLDEYIAKGWLAASAVEGHRETVAHLGQTAASVAKDYLVNVTADTSSAWGKLDEFYKSWNGKRIVNYVDTIEGATDRARQQMLFGRRDRRWGGVDYAMADGGILQAHVTQRPRVLYGEIETGGEAFIPKNGQHGRSMGILNEAAGWYGASVVPNDRLAGAVAVGAPTGAPSVTFAVNVDVAPGTSPAEVGAAVVGQLRALADQQGTSVFRFMHS